MTILATAKSKLNGNVKEAFKNEDGAIDLASIMVGIIVIGIIGGVIAATVFAVIPWAQDNGAKQQLDSVASAESAYIGLSTENSAGSFGTDAQLKSAGLFDNTNAGVSVYTNGATSTGADSHYAATVTSKTGKVFAITDNRTKAVKVTPATNDYAGVSAAVASAAN